MKIIIVNGPNLNLLGEREPEIYGSDTLDEINDWIKNHDICQNLDLEFFQSNSEGAIIDFLHSKRKEVNHLVINPGALTHYSYALRDAISGTNMKAVEIHLSDIHNRENFRKISVIKSVCLAQVVGEGKQGYITAIKHILETK
ncbi:MAG: type II 3-dehydroquinate dehydratase [Candidatus Neomarinimicrobiota bacterium]|nr:type II 3-dehydroquinate dehydratase [Candidatus Neomarinimicrobiota bacterium]MED5450985.1 type II 3-dehydroquinate dehydratase [Candidatus Neomarinimicrobiota bacterium]MEE3301760.1 type II 3-dehydroquinate dehydratase [Candidatus Neomarinimicrobiota bacterium]